MKSAACASVRENLSAYLEQDLPPGPAGEIRAHLEGCPDCRAELELLRLTLGALRCLPELPPPAGILAGVRAHLRPEPWYRRFLDRRQWLLGVPVGALATLLVVVGISFFQTRLPEPQKMGPPPVREERRTAPAPAPAPGPGPAPTAPVTPAAPRPMQQPRAAGLAKRKDLDVERSKVTEPETSRLADKVVAPDTSTAKEWREAGAEPAPGPAMSVTREAQGPANEEPGVLKRDLAGADSTRIREEEALPPSRFTIPEPPPRRAASLDDAAGSPLEEKDRRLPQGRSAAIGALEAQPKTVSTLRSGAKDTPAISARAANQGAELQRAPSAGSRPPAVRRAGGEFRMAGAPPAPGRTIQPGTIDLGTAETAPAPSSAPPAAEAETVLEARSRPRPDPARRILLLMSADGGGINDLKRLLRREGAGEVEDRVLERRDVQEAFAPHRERLALAAPPARGWTLRAELPPRALARVLDALASHPGLRLLELPEPGTDGGPAATPLQLRITVLR